MTFLALAAAINFLILVLFVVVALRNLPERIRQLMECNSTRLDGTRSLKRKDRERRGLKNFVANILVGFMLLLVLANAFILLIHLFVIPVPIAVEAVASFDIALGEWKDRIQEKHLDHQHLRWLTERRNTLDGARAHQHILWRGWPIIVIVGAILSFIGVRMFAKYYVASLRELETGAQQRYQEYLVHDVTRLESAGEAGGDEEREDEESVCGR